MSEPKDPALPKMREWPMFRTLEKRSHRAADGRPLPRIADLVMAHVPGSPLEKLAWLRQQAADGKLGGDDPEEIAQAEALLAMLARIAGGRGREQQRHDPLDGALKRTIPASDPVSVGRATSTEAPRGPSRGTVADVTTAALKSGRAAPRRSRPKPLA